MDELLKTTPPGVTVSRDMEGLRLSLPHPQTFRHHALELLGVVMMAFVPTAGTVLGVWVCVAPFIRSSGWWLLLGGLLSVIGLLVGMLAGIVVAVRIMDVLEKLLQAPLTSDIVLREHSLDLSGRQLPLGDILFVDSGAQTIVMQGGERVPVAPGATDPQRRWLIALLRGVLRSRDPAGSQADIPAALSTLKLPQ